MVAGASGRWLSGKSIALSISEPDDLATLGLSLEHFNDAFAELARALLVAGAQLLYGGDLRTGGYTELLFEMVSRYGPRRQNSTSPPTVLDVLPYPVHASWPAEDVVSAEARFSEIGDLMYLDVDGTPMSKSQRLAEPSVQVDRSEWGPFLTAMRDYVVSASQAKLVLGGRRSGYAGRMPGVMEEALIASQKPQPLFLVGGFGGVARDLAVSSDAAKDALAAAGSVLPLACNNGLDIEELDRLAVSPHIDEVTVLVLRGLRGCFA